MYLPEAADEHSFREQAFQKNCLLLNLQSLVGEDDFPHLDRIIGGLAVLAEHLDLERAADLECQAHHRRLSGQKESQVAWRVLRLRARHTHRAQVAASDQPSRALCAANRSTNHLVLACWE